MSADTKIEWTHMPGFLPKSWNPVRGCSRISNGCENCYAERMAVRFSAPGKPFDGFAESGWANRSGWTGKVSLIPEALDAPLRWRKPCCVFVNSMSDLFHESLSDEDIAAVFGVMAAAPQHRFLVLTKRAERMRRWFEWLRMFETPLPRKEVRTCILAAAKVLRERFAPHLSPGCDELTWPLFNVWLGVSVENQATADERIPQLLATPARVRFVSYEPALEAVDFSPWLRASCSVHRKGDGYRCCAGEAPRLSPLQWVIVGGESGPGARTTGLGWIRDAVNACRESGKPCFVKQVGARVASGGSMPDRPRNRKGGDPAEWPEDLRVREWPPL